MPAGRAGSSISEIGFPHLFLKETGAEVTGKSQGQADGGNEVVSEQGGCRRARVDGPFAAYALIPDGRAVQKDRGTLPSLIPAGTVRPGEDHTRLCGRRADRRSRAMKRSAIHLAERAERGVYWSVGGVLVFAAALFLVYTIAEGVQNYLMGYIAIGTIRLFNRSLLTLEKGD